MSDDYRANLEIDATAADVFAGIQDVRGWWNPTVTGSSANEGDEFVYSDEGIRFARIRLTRVKPKESMEWTVLDSYLNFVDEHDEWTGTRMVFELTPAGTATRLTFTHHGLQPQVACYQACSTGWTGCMARLNQLSTHGSDPNSTQPQT